MTTPNSALLATMQGLDAFFRTHAQANEAGGKLVPEVFEALSGHGIHRMLVPKSLGGFEMSPSEAMQVIEQISYSDGSTGWVSFVIATATGMVSGYLPDSGARKFFASGAGCTAAGSGAPTGIAVKTQGGYTLRGRWSYGSGIQHVDWTHSGAILYENGKPKIDANGVPEMMVVHAPRESIQFLGNWDTLGLRGSGSIDYGIEEAFVPDDFMFSLKGARPERRKDLFSVGVIGITSIGHSAWACGVGRRILDEIALFARTKKTTGAKTSSGPLTNDEAFWEEYGTAEGRVRAARAFLYEVWRDVEKRMRETSECTTRETTLIRLALNNVTSAAAEAADFAYRAAGGMSLREGVLQRVFRDIYTGKQHITVSANVLKACGRELAGLAPGKVWALYELVDPI